MKFLTKCVVLICALLALSSCGHYQLGRVRSAPNATQVPRVWIAPVVVEEAIADVALPLNRELRENVIRNRALKLVESKGHADVHLRVTLLSRERDSLARRSDDTGLSDVLRLELFAAYELVDSNHPGTMIRHGKVSVEGQVFRDAGFNESARQRIPAMLRDLADDILQEAFLDW